jgi:hypothetical protein
MKTNLVGAAAPRKARASGCCAVLVLGLLAPGLGAGAAAPGEDENAMFGGPASGASAAAPSPAPAAAPTSAAPAGGAPAGAPENSDAGGLSTQSLGHDDFANGKIKDNPLEIGGVVYQQCYADEGLNQPASAAALSTPLQLDTFLDARPNDRLRAYVDARMIYDGSKNAQDLPTNAAAQAALYQSLEAGSSSAVSGSAGSNPAVVLDQAWVNFDLGRLAFVTVGKQHVKWGTGHIWNPTDFLTTQVYNPLQPYDLRLGNSMVKVQVPVPAFTGTNLYAISLLDNPQPASTLGQTGGAFRAETLLWGAEIGVDAVTRPGEYPVYGADLSTALGPFDVYAENALLSGKGYPQYTYAGFTAGAPLSTAYSVATFSGPADRTVAGLSYDFPWRENRQATLGAEYFYNELGVDNAHLLPILFYLGQYQAFYEGKQYASLYLSAEGPDEGKKTSYNLSNIVNISDGSAVSRLDFTWLLLEYLTFGAWTSVHYGTQGGELNLALNTPAFTNNGRLNPPVVVPEVPVEVGMSLRMAY